MNKHQTAAKKYLSQAFGLNQRIESKLGQIEELHDLATKATVTYSDMPKNPNRGHSRMEDCICKIWTARITARSFWFLRHIYHLQYKSRCRFSHNGSLIFRFCHLNIITEAYCIELDFTVLFPESLFHQVHSCEVGIHCRYRIQARLRFPPSAYRTDISVPILSEVPYSPQL